MWNHLYSRGNLPQLVRPFQNKSLPNLLYKSHVLILLEHRPSFPHGRAIRELVEPNLTSIEQTRWEVLKLVNHLTLPVTISFFRDRPHKLKIICIDIL